MNTIEINIEGGRLLTHSIISEGAPFVVVCNAYGAPLDIWENCIKKLSAEFSIILWEPSILNVNSENSEYFVTEQDSVHAYMTKDILHIFSYFDLDSAHFLAWCSGARQAIDFYLKHPGKVRSLTLVNGAYGFLNEDMQSQHDKSAYEMLEKYHAWSGDKAGIYDVITRMVLGNVKSNEGDARVNKTVSYPYHSLEYFDLYVNLCVRLRQENYEIDFSYLPESTLYIVSLKDQVQPPQGTLYAAEHSIESQLYVDEDGDHYSLFDNDHIIDKIFENLVTQQQVCDSSDTIASAVLH